MSAGPVRVRPATAADAAALAGIYGPYVSERWVSFEQQPPDAEEMDRRRAEGMPRHPWLVAEEDGAVVGFAYAVPFRSRAAYAWSTETSVYLDRPATGRGIGRRLMGALLNLLAAQGFRTILAAVALPNAASLALHRTLGFTEVGTLHRVGFKHDEWLDVTLLELHLPTADPGERPVRRPRTLAELSPAALIAALEG